MQKIYFRNITFMLGSCLALQCASVTHVLGVGDKKLWTRSASSGEQPQRSATGTTPNNIIFNKTAFASHNNFFLGAATDLGADADKPYVLSRASVERNNGVWSVNVSPIAPEKVTLNKVPDQDNPLFFFGEKIDTLALFNKTLPVATIKSGNGAGGTLRMVTLVANPSDGSSVFANTGTRILDADGDEISLTQAESIAATTASNNTIFLAVPPNNANFGVGGSGFVRMKKEADELQVQKIDGTGSGESKAYQLRLVPHNSKDKYIPDPTFVQFVSEPDGGALPGGALGVQADLYWDDTLNCLYIGLTGAKGLDANPGSVQSLLVGKINPDNNKMFVQPAVDLQLAYSKPLFENNEVKQIFGFRNDNDASASATSAFKVRTMHTSTGKSYLIMNGGVEVNAQLGSLNTRVFALPLINSGDSKGLVSKKNFEDSDPINATDQMTTAFFDAGTNDVGGDDSLKAFVGANPKFISNGAIQSITNMQVVGDTVYVSVDGDRDPNHNNEAGIFASTALFDHKGLIRAWTPWQRVMGSIDIVQGFGFDEKAQDYWYLTSSDGSIGGQPTTVKVTRWNSGDHNNPGVHNGSPLSDVLNPTFVKKGSGVFSLTSYDGATPGFKRPDVVSNYDQLDMMIATGYGEVALIQGGQLAAPKTPGGPFIPTKEFTDAGGNPNVFIFNGNDPNEKKSAGLANLGPIVTAELSRNGQDEKGWVFVGSQGGFAVLSQNSKGFSPINQLLNTDDNFPGGTDWKWVQITKKSDGSDLDIKDVRKIVSDDTFLYILTKDTLYRITMDADGFTNLGQLADVNNLQTLTSLSLAKNADGSSNLFSQNADEFFDVVAIGRALDSGRVVLATSKGLFTNVNGFNDVKGADGHQEWQKPDKDAFDAAGPVLRLNFVGARRGGPFGPAIHPRASGNLYATALDSTNENLVVYRFNVQDGEVKSIPEPYTEENRLIAKGATRTAYFYKIGKLDENLRANVEFAGPLDFVGQTETYGSNDIDFTSQVPQEPQSDEFLKAGQKKSAINLQANLTNSLQLDTTQAVLVRDTASGALYIPGEFGVFVNE